MTYVEELEPKIDQTFISTRYNVVIEGPAIKPEEDPDAKKALPTEEPFKSIALAILYGDSEKSLKKVQESIEKKIPPLDVITKGLIKGMDGVGALYAKSLYFLPDLMISGDAMTEGVKICEAALGEKAEKKGAVVSFVAEGDPHDIGKNLVVMFLRSNGYEVIDLGRDVPTDEVIEAVQKYQPDFLTGTALMTTTMTQFPKIAEELIKKKLEVPVFGCGGGAVRRDFVESYPMGVYGVKAFHAPKIADTIIRDKKSWEKIREEYSDIVGEFVPEYA